MSNTQSGRSAFAPKDKFSQLQPSKGCTCGVFVSMIAPACVGRKWGGKRGQRELVLDVWLTGCVGWPRNGDRRRGTVNPCPSPAFLSVLRFQLSEAPHCGHSAGKTEGEGPFRGPCGFRVKTLLSLSCNDPLVITMVESY